MKNEGLVMSLLHTVEQLATKEKRAVDAGHDMIISSSKVLDVGKEIVVPKRVGKESELNFAYTDLGMETNFPLLCEVLLSYLNKKKNLPVDGHNTTEERFKRSCRQTAMAPLQFSDFFIVEQGYLFALAYLSASDEYGYEYDGLVELSAEVSIFLFENITRERIYTYRSFARQLENSPGGFYRFKSNTDVIEYIDGVISDIRGIWEHDDEPHEDDDEDDE